MPTRMVERPAPAGLSPERAGYDSDLYSWATKQAALLRAGRIGEADAPNIAEELDDVAGAQDDKLESALPPILMHMLEWDDRPERRTRSWTTTIGARRLTVATVLRKNPGLRSRLDKAKEDAFEAARFDASETDLDLSTFPKSLPYDWEDIMGREFPWPPEDKPPARRSRRRP